MNRLPVDSPTDHRNDGVMDFARTDRRAWHMRRLVFIFPVPFLVLFVCAADANAQRVTARPSLVGARANFFERTNVSSSINRPGFITRFGGGGGAPPFGGFTPAAGLSTGFSTGRSRMFMHFSQGTSRSLVSTAPVLTTSCYYPAWIFTGVQRPFVVGFLPPGAGVLPVGPFFNVPPAYYVSRVDSLRLPSASGSGRAGRRRASATMPSRTVSDRDNRNPLARAAIDPIPPTRSERRAQEEAKRRERLARARVQYARGRQSEDAGRPAAARVFYRMAAESATGPLQDLIAARMTALATRNGPTGRPARSNP